MELASVGEELDKVDGLSVGLFLLFVVGPIIPLWFICDAVDAVATVVLCFEAFNCVVEVNFSLARVEAMLIVDGEGVMGDVLSGKPYIFRVSTSITCAMLSERS